MSDVGRRSEPARIEGRNRSVPGEVGVWLFILGDMVVFALLFGTLVWTQTEDPALYEASQSELHVGIGVVNTALLLTSSLVVALGVRAARAAEQRHARRLFGIAIGCAVAFVAMKGVEYTDLGTDAINARTNDYFLYFFTFTGLHLLHVIIGICVLAGVIRLVKRPALGEHDVMMVENGASYWHMVDLLWIVLFALLYLLG